MVCKIKETREKLGMSQKELAKKSGISRYLISKLENGEDVNITKRTMVLLSNALNKSVSEIFLF